MSVWFLLVFNVISYCLMAYDKYLAINNKWRISEKTLFLFAFLFGAVGIYLAMQMPINHKSSKPVFKILIPLCIVINALSIYFIVYKI